MRQQGRITVWKDEKGFGFVTPDDGGEQAFLHISAFENRRRRPTVNELVTYEPSTDSQGRRQAAGVRFSGEGRRRISPMTLSSLLLVTGFAAFLAGGVLVGRLPKLVAWAYLAIGVVTFFAYASDKFAAVDGRQRIPEKMLHLFSLAGGWPGGLLAQRAFRHKSSKVSFQVTYWITVIANCGILWWLMSPTGARGLRILGLVP